MPFPLAEPLPVLDAKPREVSRQNSSSTSNRPVVAIPLALFPRAAVTSVALLSLTEVGQSVVPAAAVASPLYPPPERCALVRVTLDIVAVFVATDDRVIEPR